MKDNSKCFVNHVCHKIITSDWLTDFYYKKNGQKQNLDSAIYKYKNYKNYPGDNRGQWTIETPIERNWFWEWIGFNYQDQLKKLFGYTKFNEEITYRGINFDDVELKNKTENEVINLI